MCSPQVPFLGREKTALLRSSHTAIPTPATEEQVRECLELGNVAVFGCLGLLKLPDPLLCYGQGHCLEWTEAHKQAFKNFKSPWDRLPY